MNTLHFACGATYEVNAEPLKNKAGNLAHLLVYVQGQDKPESPKLDGKEMNCLYMCPCATRGKRKEQRAWVGDAAIKPTSEPVRCVLCKPTSVTEHANGESSNPARSDKAKGKHDE